MLRLTAIALLLVNIGYFLWTHNQLSALGLPAPDGTEQSEPQRLQQQLRPDALRILNQDENKRAGAAVPNPPTTTPVAAVAECLQAGVYDARQAALLRQAAAAQLPPNSWAMESAMLSGRWILFMGKYADDETLARKKAELRARKVSFEELADSVLGPGLSLGSYATQELANQGLAALAARGVRTARVVQERADAQGQTFRLPAVDEGIRARLDGLRAALAGKTLRACE